MKRGATLRKNILISGASSGLGAGMAREFAKRGHNLALCARRSERLAGLQSGLRATDVQVVVRALDVTDSEAVFRVFRELSGELGSLDRVIVNAGVGFGQSLGTGPCARYAAMDDAVRPPLSRHALRAEARRGNERRDAGPPRTRGWCKTERGDSPIRSSRRPRSRCGIGDHHRGNEVITMPLNR